MLISVKLLTIIIIVIIICALVSVHEKFRVSIKGKALDTRYVIDISAASYKMTEMMPSTSAHLIDRSEDVIFELV